MNRLRTTYAELLTFCYQALDSVDQRADSVTFDELSALTYHAAVRYSQLMMNGRRADSAAGVIGTVLARVPLAKYEVAAANVMLGQARQAAGKLDSAIAAYNRAVGALEPPIDRDGNVAFGVFDVPAHLYQVYARIGDSVRGKVAMGAAQAYYENMIARFPGTKLSLASHAMVAKIYSDLGDWNAAIAAYGKLVDSTGAVELQARLKIADISAGQLGRYDEALASYDAIGRDLRGRDTLYRPEIMIKKSLVLLEQKKFADARQTLVEMQKQFPGYYASAPLAQLTRAKTFEQEGNWKRAESEYEFLVENYSASEEAFSTMLYLREQYVKQGRQLEADKMWERAGREYNAAVLKGAGTRKEAMALTFVAELHRQKGEWKEAATTLASIFDKFPETDIGQKSAITAAAIYREKLQDPKSADSLYQVYVQTMTKLQDPEP